MEEESRLLEFHSLTNIYLAIGSKCPPYVDFCWTQRKVEGLPNQEIIELSPNEFLDDIDRGLDQDSVARVLESGATKEPHKTKESRISSVEVIR